MGVQFKTRTSDNSIIGLWEITETVDQLTELLGQTNLQIIEEEVTTLCDFKSEKRKCELLASRLLLSDMLGRTAHIRYDSHGKPHLVEPKLSISISHKFDLVIILLTPKKHAGIDIEFISEKIATVALKFLNPAEFENIDTQNKIFHLYIHWCAKEVLYKIYGKRNLRFKENLTIAPFEPKPEGNLVGFIKNDHVDEEYLLRYFTFGDYVVVWGVK